MPEIFEGKDNFSAFFAEAFKALEGGMADVAVIFSPVPAEFFADFTAEKKPYGLRQQILESITDGGLFLNTLLVIWELHASLTSGTL